MPTALITGGTRGIGLGIAGALARAGYDLVLGYNADADAAARAEQQLEALGVRVECVGGDIAEQGTMARLFAAVHEHFGGQLQAFVHNAGLYVGLTSAPGPTTPNPMGGDFEAVWEYYQRVYPRAFKRGLQAALECEGLRHVVAISSPGCNATQPPQTGYEDPGQAKAAVEFLVRIHAKLLAPRGINVNAVIPGFVRTDAWDALHTKAGMPREAIEGWMLKSSPAQRWMEPSEIGEVVAFLCSSRAAMLTGVALPVDGGLHLVG